MAFLQWSPFLFDVTASIYTCSFCSEMGVQYGCRGLQVIYEVVSNVWHTPPKSVTVFREASYASPKC